jgi:hypothetical protein
MRAVSVIFRREHCSKENGVNSPKKRIVSCGLTKPNMWNEWSDAVGRNWDWVQSQSCPCMHFTNQSVRQLVYIKGKSSFLKNVTPRWGGFQYLHRIHASRRRRQEGNPVPGDITEPPCSCGMGTWPSRLWESRIWDSKIWPRVPWDSEPRLTALARVSRNCKWQTHFLVRESTPHQQTYNSRTEIKIWSWNTDGCLTPRQTGRLTVGGIIILTLTLQNLRMNMAYQLDGHRHTSSAYI